MLGIPTLTAGIGGIGAELPRSLAPGMLAGPPPPSGPDTMHKVFMCPITVIPACLERKPRFQMGIWEYPSTLAEHIQIPVSPPSWG